MFIEPSLDASNPFNQRCRTRKAGKAATMFFISDWVTDVALESNWKEIMLYRKEAHSKDSPLGLIVVRASKRGPSSSLIASVMDSPAYSDSE